MSNTQLLLDSDPITGTVRTFHIMPNDEYGVETRVDVEPVIEQAKVVNRETSDYGPSRWKGDMHLVANIPNVIWHQLRGLWRERGYSYEERQKALKDFVNSPENSMFRAKPGRV